MDGPRFVIEASEAESMAKQSGITVLQLLPSLVKSAQALARPPISKYHVGAAAIGSSGRIFLGVNLEFPGLPLHHSVHAEQFLVTNLSINSEPCLRYLAVSAAPCGHCRQFLQEIRGAPEINLLITSPEHEAQFNPLSEFLPNRFGPDDLLDKEVPLLLETHHNGLSLSLPIVRETSDLSNGDRGGDLKRAALEAANKSHAPYSGCPSGVALVDADGKVYLGSYMESAAYNPSLGPVQAAVVAYLAGGGGGYEKIVGAVLVEKQDAPVKQEHTARLLLQTIAPGCDFQDLRPSIRPPPTTFQSSRIGVEAPTASPQIEGIKTGKSKPAQHISGNVANTFRTGKSQDNLLKVRSVEEQIGSVRDLDLAKLSNDTDQLFELSTRSQSIGTNTSLKNTSKLLREEEVDTKEEQRSPETLMITPMVEETTFSDRMANELVLVHQASNYSSNKLDTRGNFVLQESESGERKDFKNSDLARVSNDNLKSLSNKEGYQHSLESSVAWIFPDEAKHLCITTSDELVMDLMGGCKTEAYTLHEQTSFHVSEVDENLMRSGSNINVNKGDKTSHGLRKSNSGSTEDNMSSGPVGQAIKIALMAAFGILVLLTRQSKNR